MSLNLNFQWICDNLLIIWREIVCESDGQEMQLNWWLISDLGIWRFGIVGIHGHSIGCSACVGLWRALVRHLSSIKVTLSDTLRPRIGHNYGWYRLAIFSHHFERNGLQLCRMFIPILSAGYQSLVKLVRIDGHSGPLIAPQGITQWMQCKRRTVSEVQS